MEEVRGLQWTPKKKDSKEKKIMWSAMNLSMENRSRLITRKTHPEFGSSRRRISKSVRLSTLMPRNKNAEECSCKTEKKTGERGTNKTRAKFIIKTVQISK